MREIHYFTGIFKILKWKNQSKCRMIEYISNIGERQKAEMWTKCGKPRNLRGFAQRKDTGQDEEK